MAAAGMTTKDYKLIAEVVKQLPTPQRQITAGRFARRLKADNPQFRPDLFADACNVKFAPNRPMGPLWYGSEADEGKG